MSRRGNFLILGGVVAVVIAVVYLGLRSSLDPLERDCQAHVLGEPRMAGIDGLFIESHYATSEPGKPPKVIFVIDFGRGDQHAHRAWIECLYVDRASAGAPPRLDIDHVAVRWEHVKEDNRWVPWHPTAAAAEK